MTPSRGALPVYIALLRGVNVGGAKRVPMADFRALLGRLGFANVATLLNSGNAVFTAGRGSAVKFAAEIAAGLRRDLEVDVAVVVKSAADLAAIVHENPFAAAPEPSRVLVAFAPDAASLAGLAPIAALVTPPDQFVVGRHAAYLHCAGGILESKAGAALLGKPGRAVTTRNWTTVLKLHALATGGQR